MAVKTARKPAAKFGLSTQEAADFLGLSESYLRKLRRSGEVSGPLYIKIGKRCLYTRENLRAWALAHPQRATA